MERMERYEKTFTVRWADCDLNGHMRNTSYSEYAIDTRVAFFAERGLPYAKFVESGGGIVILHEAIDYLREVGLGETIAVDFTLHGLSADRVRFRYGHDIWLPSRKKAARIVLEGGWMDLRLRKLRIPPDEVIRAIEAVPRGEPFEELKPLKRP